MFRFEHGDQDNLKGKAIVYTHNISGEKGNPINSDYPALFVGTNANELREAMESCGDISEELKDKLIKEHEEEVKELFRQWDIGVELSEILSEGLREYTKKHDVPGEARSTVEELIQNYIEEKKKAKKQPLAPCLGINPTFDPENLEPHRLNCDVIRANDVSDMAYALLVLEGISRIYVITYVNQRESRIVVPKGYKAEIKNFREMTTGEFKNEITGLSSRLVYAENIGEDTSHIFADLKELTAGSPFIGDVVNLYNVSRTQDPNKIKLMSLYFSKIFAIADERYEDAGEINEQIQKMSP